MFQSVCDKYQAGEIKGQNQASGSKKQLTLPSLKMGHIRPLLGLSLPEQEMLLGEVLMS